MSAQLAPLLDLGGKIFHCFLIAPTDMPLVFFKWIIRNRLAQLPIVKCCNRSIFELEDPFGADLVAVTLHRLPKEVNQLCVGGVNVALKVGAAGDALIDLSFILLL